MKVIGKSERGYLIAASDTEIANLFGFSRYDDAWKDTVRAGVGYNNYQADNLVGLEIHVATAYAQLEWMRRRDREFDEMTKNLRNLADQIQNTKPLFDSIIGDKPKVA